MDIDIEMLTNVINAMQPWWLTIKLIFYFSGFCLVIVGVLSIPNNIKQSAFMRSAFNHSVWVTVTGFLLLNLPAVLDAASYTIFDQSTSEWMSYSSSTEDVFGKYKEFAVYLTTLIGLIGFGVGVLKLRQVRDNPYVFGKALAFMTGGTVAVNIITFAEAIGVTIGGDVENIIKSFFDLT